MILFKNARLSSGQIMDISVLNGKIHQVAPTITDNAFQIINCEGRLLLSGMIDCHVHFRDPGFTHKEDAESGSKAALRGGVTSFLDMPNTSPLCVESSALIQKHQIYKQNSYVNYGFHFGGDARNNASTVRQTQGFASLKIFLNESTGHMLVTDDQVLDQLFQSSHFISVHAEGDAVDKAIYFAKKHQNNLYLCHISQEEELHFIKKAKEQKLPVFAEVCPHHVYFNQSHITSLLTMKPQLRSARDQEKMLEALDQGLIDTWGTDHAPHLISEKESQTTYGIPSVEFALELLLKLAKEMNWSPQKVESLYSSHPQKIFRIKNKANIVHGFDADFVLIDEDPYTIKETDIMSKCNWSPYLGTMLTHQIHSTYIGGECVYDKETQTFRKSNYTQELIYAR